MTAARRGAQEEGGPPRPAGACHPGNIGGTFDELARSRDDGFLYSFVATKLLTILATGIVR